MQRRTFKQKCLAWLLSLAVAVTFIPMTAGFAFADDMPQCYVNLEHNGVSSIPDDEIKNTINLSAPWQSSEGTVTSLEPQVYTGQEMKPELVSITCKGGAPSFYANPEEDQLDVNDYVTIDYGEGNWTDVGTYTLTITGNEEAEPFIYNSKFLGTDVQGSFKGAYIFTFTISADAKDLSSATVNLSESAVVFDGNEHKPDVTSVVDADGNTVDSSYYDVDYPGSWNKKTGEYELTQNAYTKVGSYDVRITAKEGNEGGYTGSATATIEIKDNVTKLAVYKQNGENGERSAVQTFNKGEEWDSLAVTNPFKYGYNGKTWTTSKYIPVEKLLSEAGLCTLGEDNNLNDKDGLEIWSNSQPQKYAGLNNYQFGLMKSMGFTADGGSILDKFGGEYSIPAFLILDTEDESASPMIGVGYSSEDANSYPRGFYFCKPVSEVVLINMNIENLPATVANTTYTGKAAAPKVEVKDGSVSVPVEVKCEDVNVGEATATITAKDDSAYYGTVTKTFKINKAAQTITVSKASFTKTFGNAAFALGAKANGGGKLTYASSNTKVATVSTAGKVTIKGAGTAKITVNAAATGNYNKAAKTVTVKVNKAANPMTVKAKTASVKRSKVKKAAQKLAVSKVMTISKKQGTVTYAKVSGSGKLSIAKTTGKVTVKKKTKKGTYKMKVKVSAAGNANYKAGSKTVTVTVRVK